jgi:nicotinamide phosphoribosyltransferase
MNQQESHLPFNLILMTDSYKLSHAPAYPKNMSGMHAYIEARLKGSTVVFVGLQMLIKKWLQTPITPAMIAEAADFTQAHGEPFEAAPWLKVIERYDGFLPLIIHAVPEGTRVPGQNVLCTIECTDPDLAFLASYIETLLQGGVWYPTTIATLDYEVKQKIKHYYDVSGADMNLLPFALHDFGARGVTCSEQARIGGAAHMVNFMGSDTVEGILAANYHYDCGMAGFSVYATEHSVECSFGPSKEDAIRYIRTQIENAKSVGAPIVSIVIDGYDMYREVGIVCNELRDFIINSGVRVVLRPDSGDMMDTVPYILGELEKAFGVTLTDKGYRKINYVGVIQGDGVDRLSIDMLLGKVVVGLKYSADCVLFGSGGALLQKVNRDTLKFAQKACLVGLNDGSVKGIAKNPVTDSGKKSKEGRWVTIRRDGKVIAVPVEEMRPTDDNLMVVVYDKGEQFNRTTLDEIRMRVAI